MALFESAEESHLLQEMGAVPASPRPPQADGDQGGDEGDEEDRPEWWTAGEQRQLTMAQSFEGQHYNVTPVENEEVDYFLASFYDDLTITAGPAEVLVVPMGDGAADPAAPGEVVDGAATPAGHSHPNPTIGRPALAPPPELAGLVAPVTAATEAAAAGGASVDRSADPAAAGPAAGAPVASGPELAPWTLSPVKPRLEREEQAGGSQTFAAKTDLEECLHFALLYLDLDWIANSLCVCKEWSGLGK
jgi:hypothetical protein